MGRLDRGRDQDEKSGNAVCGSGNPIVGRDVKSMTLVPVDRGDLEICRLVRESGHDFVILLGSMFSRMWKRGSYTMS
jgi:hypothetical protein